MATAMVEPGYDELDNATWYVSSHNLYPVHSFWCFFLNFYLDQGLFCGTTDCPYFGLLMTLPMGFKARVVLSPAHLLAHSEPKGHINACAQCEILVKSAKEYISPVIMPFAKIRFA